MKEFDKDNLSYPLILCSYSLKKQSNSLFYDEAETLMFNRFYKTCLQNCNKTIIHEPFKPSLNYSLDINAQHWSFFNILCILLGFWIILPLLFIIFINRFLKFIYQYLMYVKNYQDYKKILQSNNECISFNEFYSSIQSKFFTYFQTAEDELKNINQELDEINHRELTKSIIPPVSIKPNRKGISEMFFVDKLLSYFDFFELEIITDCTVNGFYPDIVLHTKTGFYIDIEIDEPYVGNTKKIIHYYEPESKYHCDEFRNKCLLECGWIIIRFSEKQIIKNYNSCCYEIALFLSQIYDFTIPKNKIHERLTPEAFWSKVTAEDWALSDYRFTYLPVLLKLKLNQYN